MRFGALVAALWLAAGCDSGSNRHLKQLAREGIEPSGRSLLEAVVAGESRRIEWLLAAQVHTEQRDETGKTPLRIALERRDLHTVFKLLDAGADVNATTPDGTSILGVALALEETAVAAKIFDYGGRTDGRTPDGEKILPAALRDGRLAFIHSLRHAAIDPHEMDSYGNSLLHIAIQNGRRAEAEKLIALGADPGMSNQAGETTLHLALRHGWTDLLPKLVAAGADPNAAPPGSPTLLEQAVADRDPVKTRLFLKIGANPNHPSGTHNGEGPLATALSSGHQPLIDIFLQSGAKPPGGNWQPWLETAWKSRNLPLAKSLLSHGIRSEKSAAVLEAAVLQQETAFINLFLNHGFPTGASLHIAAARGDAQTASLLLAAGADPNGFRIPYHDTPLSIAVRRGNDHLAHFLLRHGATPGWPLAEGQSLFHLAIATGCHRTVKHLLDAGVDPNTPIRHPVSPDFIQYTRPGVIRWILKNDRNVTPLMIAADSGNLHVTRYLLAAGAKKSVWTHSSRLWPINFASRRNDVKMMRLILGQNPDLEERHIVVKIGEQKAWLYDAQGNEIFSTRVSTGKKGKATPTGEFVITNKHRTWTSTIYDSSMPFFQRLSCSDFGLHQGYVPGYPASSGCIRIPAGNAARLFALTQAGDRVCILP